MKTILAVDDEYDMVDALRLLLKDEGYRVVTAASGEEALARLAEAPPDAVLLDIMMPGMDGREVLRVLQQHPSWRSIPVIVMTAAPRALSEDERSKIRFLPKPFMMPELLGILGDIFRERTA